MASARHSLAVLEQRGQIIIDRSEKLEIDQDLVKRRVSNPLTDPQDRPVDTVRAGLQGVNRVRHRQTAIVVAVPVDFDTFARSVDQVSRPPDEVENPVRCGVTDRVAQHQATDT